MANSLAGEKSPYLLQHATNPVEWLLWGEAAFTRAQAEDKPIFLSIGYSTCHWCHVMAHESFEHSTIAAYLNQHFISIKVDREERPDVDKVYMAYVQAMTGHGGWPLSVFLTPALLPFYGGTYFYPEDRSGRSGLLTILHALNHAWGHQRSQILTAAANVVAELRAQSEKNGDDSSAGGLAPANPPPLIEIAGETFERGFAYFHQNADETHGGFGGAPKFPRAANLSFLFRVAALQGPASEIGAEAIRLATATLRGMARGGIHDHLGGGYHRYAVDAGWLVPHFEKMLYDQAQIAVNCLEAKQATGDERFAWMARDIFDYVARDLTSPAGGFYTAEDADSAVGLTVEKNESSAAHGSAEGAFYLWTAQELQDVLGDNYALAAAHFGVESAGNVAATLNPHGEFNGQNILTQRHSLAETAQRFSLTAQAANDRLLAIQEQLRAVRCRRPRPLRDDKILAASNGLMITALARAAAILNADAAERGKWLHAATRAAEFIEREMYDQTSGVVFRAWREGRGRNAGFAEDYILLIQGLLDLYEASLAVRWLRWAEKLQAKCDELFWDEVHGGYFNSSAQDTNIIVRWKENYDSAEPAPSSIAALNLLRAGALWHDEVLSERGRRTIQAFQKQWHHSPQSMPFMLCALELAIASPRHVVLVGTPARPDFQALLAVLMEKIGPRRSILATGAADADGWLTARAPWLAGMTMIDGQATAYVCEDFSCRAPATTAEALRTALS